MKNKLKSYMTITLGLALTAFSTGQFYLPNDIVTGGVAGIATIMQHIGVPPGAVYLGVNLLLLLLSLRLLGRAFVKKAILSVIVLSGFVQLSALFPPVTRDPFLASFFGSCIFGIGAALAFSENANTGGTDIIGRLIQVKLPYFPIGRLLLIIDGVIILLSLLLFKNIDLALYGLFGLSVSAFVIDYFIDRLNSSKLAFVITDRGEELSRMIIETSRRGVTVLNARGAYSGTRKKLLICALKNRQMPDFHKMVTEADENAFVIFTKSEKIFGLGFYVYH